MRKLDRGREIAKRRRRREPRAPRRAQPSRTWRFLRWLLPSRPLDAVAIAIAIFAVSAVLSNALLLQRERHPAPLFAEPAQDSVHQRMQQAAVRPSAPPADPVSATAPVPAPRPEAAVRGKPGLVLDIQKALAERGYYDGVADGLMGPRTQQAIREFEEAQGLKPTGEVSEALLARVLNARARGEITGSIPAAPRPSTKVLAVQRVLARLGYGPVDYSGLEDESTKRAIERFERDRGMMKTGTIGAPLLDELAAVTGAPVE